MQHAKYLKDKLHYEDQYDRMTVERCRSTEKIILGNRTKTKPTGPGKQLILELALYFETGEFYAEKEKIINDWMERDRWRDEKYERTMVPLASCRLCNKSMELIFKDLSYEDNYKKEQMKFYFGCSVCKLSVTIYENGSREENIPWKCPDCGRELQEKVQETKTVITIHKKCSFCGFKKTEKLDLRSKKSKLPTLEEEAQFRKDKARFCLSHEEGSKYVSQRTNISYLNEMMKEKEKPIVKQLNFVEVEQILRATFEEHGFTRLIFDKPGLKEGVTVSFTVQDSQNRKDYASQRTLKKLIRTALLKSNWRLVADDVDYQLGILSGRLKGEENPAGCYVEIKERVEFVKF